MTEKILNKAWFSSTINQREELEDLLLEHVNGRLYLDIWKLGVNVALRISDLLVLTMDQVRAIDPDRLQLAVTEQKTQKNRVITLNTSAMDIINRRLRDNAGDVWLFQSPLPVKRGHQPTALTRRAVAKAFSDTGNRINPRVNMSTHIMRKTRGYAMYRAGSSLEHISKALNHSNPAVTMRYIGITAENVADSFRELVL